MSTITIDLSSEAYKKLSRDAKGLTKTEKKLLSFMGENVLVHLDVDGCWRLC